MTRYLLSLAPVALAVCTLAGCAAAPVAAQRADHDMPHASGLDVAQSPYDTAETIQRFQNIARNNGLTVFDTVDHAEGATSAGLDLPPTALVIFGNPKAGTPLMQCGRTMAIDLPSKALAWTDDTGQTWFAMNDIEYLAARHHIGDCPAVPKVNAMLHKLMDQTVAPAMD